MTEDDLKDMLRQFTIGVMHVQPGDVIVLKADVPLSVEAFRSAKKVAEEVWPDNKVIVGSDSMTISIIRNADGGA